MSKKRDWRRYKEKQCPVCGKIHKGYRAHCSLSCGNKSRKFREETKQKISESLKRHYQNTPEGIAFRQHITNRNLGIATANQENIMIEIPVFYDIDW